MSELSLFLKGNKKERKNGFFPATKSLCDENGEPLLWEFKPLPTHEAEVIRDECMIQKLVPGRTDQFEMKLNTRKFMAMVACACIVNPNLNNAELQDSYGVKTPEALLQEMIDDPGEYNTFVAHVVNYNGFDDINELREEAKN